MTAEAKILFRIIVTGKVQGVGFRWSTLREARRMDITGYVKNLPDRSVYIEAEGTREQLEVFTAWCRKGPGVGLVNNIEVTEHLSVGYREFRIEH